MEQWVREFDSWDICDLCCIHLFRKTPYNYRKAFEWVERENVFEKRAGFALMAALAVHDKKVGNEKFEAFLPLIRKKQLTKEIL